jgi:hypothetical protein
MDVSGIKKKTQKPRYNIIFFMFIFLLKQYDVVASFKKIYFQQLADLDLTITKIIFCFQNKIIFVI